MMGRAVRPLSVSVNKLGNGQADVLGNPPKQGGDNIMTSVEWHGCSAPVRMSVLAVGPALTNKLKAKPQQPRFDLAGLQNGGRAHQLSDLDGMRADEFGFEAGFAILQQHPDDLFHVRQEFIDCRALRMSARPARDMAHVETGICVAFNNCRVATHGIPSFCESSYKCKHNGSGLTSP